MAFTLDRTEAAKRLGVSTRTVDRHIQSNRIRTRRIGKKMFLEEDDYVVILNEEPMETEQEILPTRYNKSQEISPDAKMALTEFSRIYTDAQGIIAKKDEVIKDLSYKVGKMETELENSINVSEYQRTANLLENAKNKSAEDARFFGEKISTLEKEVQKKNSFIVGMVILFVLVILSSFLFFLYSRFM